MAKGKSGAKKPKLAARKAVKKAKSLPKRRISSKKPERMIKRKGHEHPAKANGKPAAKAGKHHALRAERVRPRATKLPPLGEPLTKREMEHLLSAGEGRGVFGEGSLKGRLTVKEGLPYLQVIGRDKRELEFLLQGPDQEVLPAYVGHKVSVSGLIKKTHNYGGTIDVRKYAAKR